MLEKSTKKFALKSRKAAIEGIILLKNKDEMLPLKKEDRVSVFGRPMIETYRSGTGSGGAVQVPYMISILEGLQNKKLNINNDIIDDYKEWLKENPFDNGGGGWAAEPWFQKDMDITADYAKEHAKKTNKAIYIIGRTAGEDKDNFAGEGSYFLTKQEYTNIQNITKAFEDVCIILNVSNVIDMKWIEDVAFQGRIKAVLLVWQGGMEGGNAIADILSGTMTPSGKLPDTIAYDIEDYPSTKNFGNEFENLYEEDIYVGYRYFETFAPKKVFYEFGYGLSYTTFQIETLNIKEKKESIVFKIKVSNIGNKYSGKEVVQIYLEAPQGKLGKPKKVLVGFYKTKKLKPKKSETFEIEISKRSMSSYDDSDVTGHKSCYVLEEGEYCFYVGNSVRKNTPAYTYQQEQLQVIEKLSEALCPNNEKLMLLKPGKKNDDGTYERTYITSQKPTVDLQERIEKNLPKSMEITGNVGITLKDVKNKKADIDSFIAQLSVEDLALIVRGEGMSNPRVTSGTASAFGGLSDTLFRYGIPVACCADGPSGLRHEGQAVQVPIGTALASSFNPKLVRELYTLEGKELVRNKVDTLLGPGVNIHRSVLNGRNFEYYSEDPYLSGVMATATCGGIKDGGAWGTIKHFALNGQETHRFKVNAVASERAIREIYLKAFEMPIKAGEVMALMTAYNPINDHFAASNYDLCTTILRNEWGYQGMVMTDWWAKMNDVVKGGEASAKKVRDMVRSQNDVYMVVNNNGAEVNSNSDDTEEAIKEGRLTVGELQQAAKNICRFILNAPVIKRKLVDTDVAKEYLSVPASEAKYEQFYLKENDKILFDGKKEATMIVDECGEYTIIVNISFAKSNLAQSTVNVVANGETMAVIQTNGTDGNFITQKLCKVKLNKGIYNIKLEDVLAGIEVKYIQFKKTISSK